MRYNHARKKLRELDPTNPNLPTFWRRKDRHTLDRKIDKLKKERKLRTLERHHLYPGEFESDFRTWGIKPEDYVMFVEREPHRLRPSGLHAGPDHWNAQWRRFIEDELTPNEERAIEQLNRMMKRIPWLKP